MSRGNIITFYSYKGGVGRTFTLANIAALLSLWGYKTLCVDWDLEAPGLHLYFKPWLKQENSPGLVELIQAYTDGKEPNWRDFVTEVAIPGASQPLLMMQAGLLDSSYVQRMQALDWNSLYEHHLLGHFIEELREAWKETFDFILIDSRTGVTDTASICTVQLPDILMLILTANNQSLAGSVDTLERIQTRRASFPFDRSKLLVVPVISRFEGRVEHELADLWMEHFAQVLPAMYGDWVHKDIKGSDLLIPLRIPHVPIWNFGEEVPVLTKGTNDPEDIGYSLETLAALIAQNLSATDVLIQNRNQYVSTAKIMQQLTRAGRPKKKVKVYISYSHHDELYMLALKAHLASLERQGMIEVWDDRNIPTGAVVVEELNQRLGEADLILLLISSDYLASDYRFRNEMYAAIERQRTGQAIVIPIIVRATDWTNTPIAQLQVLPRSAVPISSRRNIDEAWLDVTKSIRQVIDKSGLT